MKNLPVSVVIPAFNCEKTIAKTIEAVLNQSYQNIELIVVDDGSTDGSAEILQVFADLCKAQNKSFKYIYQENQGPASARNHGAQEAYAEFVFFTDSDCIPCQDWIEQAMIHFEDSSVAVVAGSYGIANPEFILARCVYQEIFYRHHLLMPKYPKAFGSYNFGIRKKVFDSVGGFNLSYRYASGEDNDLSYKILKAGYRIYFERASLVEHYHPTDLKKYLTEQFRHGFWRVKMYTDYPAMMKGDDYTFWKDIVEIPWTGMVLIAFIAGVLSSFQMSLFVWLAVFLFMLELYYAIFIIEENREKGYWAWVMFLRSFARMLGFSKGIIYYLINIKINKQ
jgi:glycosyltransferase involved in cell wall biosynthesis